jgi:hypothetical protein
MVQHALLSASSSQRWLNCTPSARLEEHFENTSSIFAEEGTAAHALAEYKLKKYLGTNTEKPVSEFDGEEGHVNVYSVDGDGYGLTQVKKGTIDATFGLDPYGWASSAVEALKTHFDGGKVDSTILIGGNIVTKDNLEELKEAGSLWGAGSMEN